MRKIEPSGLPIYISNKNDLSFHEGLFCDSTAKKLAGQLQNLLYSNEIINDEEICYKVYRDISFEEDRYKFQHYDFRYDITLIMPGKLQNECKKTSGHYHGYIKSQPFTFPEVYEVLVGKAIYLLQKVPNFNMMEEEPIIEDLRAVVVEAGQAIVIPPFYGHCSINVGDGPMVFSNIAVVSCPLYYEPIRSKHGLSTYILKKNDDLIFEPNTNYKKVPDIKIVHPKENPSLGITFGEPVYRAFIDRPQQFDFLLNPASYMDAIEQMLN